MPPSLDTVLSPFPQTLETLHDLPIEKFIALVVYLLVGSAMATLSLSMDGKTTIVTVVLDSNSKARLIGKHGHTVKALCSLCRAIERFRGQDVVIEVLDQE